MSVEPVVDLAVERAGGLHPPAEPLDDADVVVSSTLAFHPRERHIGLAPEGWGTAPEGSPAAAWRRFERRALDGGAVVLRAAPCPVRGGLDVFSRWLDRRLVPTAFGFDPPIQLLHPDDLASAIRWAAGLPPQDRPAGVVHVVPRRPLFVRRAARLGRRRPGLRVALPRWLLRRLGFPADHLRHPFTARGDRAAALGWTARYTTREALRHLGSGVETPGARPRNRSGDGDGDGDGDMDPTMDPFGMDPAYIGRFEATLFRFLHDVYWRVEYEGLEHLPRSGAAILVGVHRGFMPWDGVMMLLAAHRETGRWVRFLIHPGLVKMPVLAPYMNKLGGVVACRENADWMLEHGRLLGVFPEGIRGAFRLYRDWAKVGVRPGRFGSDEFVRQALRHGVPVVPFVTVGSAEIFPIWAKIRWRWWRRVAEWPFVPVTTPIPLPSKWHTRMLEPVDLRARARQLGGDPDPATAADDADLVEALSSEIQAELQHRLDDLRRRRKGIFRGSIFEAHAGRTSE